MNLSKSINVVKSPLRTAQLFVFAAILTVFTESCKPEFSIDNPYEKVNWEEYGQYKADLHAHTSVSDGWFSPHIVVDRYHDLGYNILALADHNVQTYPWQKFSSFKASSVTQGRYDESRFDGIPYEDIFVYENRDPENIGMVAIQSNEISQHHHLGSYFSNIGHYDEFIGNYFSMDADFNTTTTEESLEAIAEKNGLAIIFHPGGYDGQHSGRPFHEIEWYVNLYRRYDHLIGMEVYNGFIDNWDYMDGKQNQASLHRWDSTLVQLMPDRPVWGFANDDFHGGTMGRTWNVLLLPALSIGEVRNGMENGLSYFVYALEGHDGPTAPEIKSIEVDSRKGTIHIEASGHQYIEWISDGAVIFVGDHINISALPNIGSYVRANVYQSTEGPLAATQPFGIRRN